MSKDDEGDSRFSKRWSDVVMFVQRTDDKVLYSSLRYKQAQVTPADGFTDKSPAGGGSDKKCYVVIYKDCKVVLTWRERQVARLIASHGSANRIAKKIGISTRTVEQYTANLKMKFNAKSKSELSDLIIKYNVRSQLD